MLICHILGSFFFVAFFFTVAFSVCFTPTICTFIYLDFVFFSLFFFVSLKNIPRHKLFWPIFNQPNDLILNQFKGNTVLLLPSDFFKLVICFPIGLLKFVFSF